MKAFKYIFSFLIVVILLKSCASSDDVSAPIIEYREETPTITLDELYAKAATNAQLYTENDILEAYVSSSDESGTFYKSVSLQNREGTKGFSIAVDMYNINNYLNPGRKVYIHLQGLYFAIAHNSLILGDLYQETNVGRLRKNDFYKKVFPSATVLNEDDFVQKVSLSKLKNNNFINILVEVDEVQFQDASVGKPFFDPNNAYGGATNHKIVDATGNMNFRTSEYAKFASRIVPANSGKIRGVLTKYNSDFQFMIRTFNDLHLDKPRNRASTAIGGENKIFNATVNENFESFSVSSNNQTSFPQYGNDYSFGERYWAVRSFDNNKYIQLNSYNSEHTITKSYFIVPVQFNGNNTLSFETKDGYYNGDVLHVYYVLENDYPYGSFIETNRFTEITNYFQYSKGNPNSYASQFLPSGNYQFPNDLNGNGYVIFEYSGTKTVTTTIQIDHIRFW